MLSGNFADVAALRAGLRRALALLDKYPVETLVAAICGATQRTRLRSWLGGQCRAGNAIP